MEEGFLLNNLNAFSTNSDKFNANIDLSNSDNFNNKTISIYKNINTNKGNIKVGVRIRPKNLKEKKEQNLI